VVLLFPLILFLKLNKKKEGDPICDSFYYCQFANRSIMAIADGCNWGEKPKIASVIASDIAVSELSSATIDNIQQAGTALIGAFEKAHEKIVEGKPIDSIWEIGTTTLLAGILFETQVKDNWLFLCLSVGDCKAFHWSAKSGQVIDITCGNRKNLTDPRDPGGRIGPHVAAGLPDWRNLDFYSINCQEGDIIFCVSDGVHDNLDPQELGLLPKQVGMPNIESWKEAEAKHPDETERVKTEQRTTLLKKLLKEALEAKKTRKLTPADVVQSWMKHCSQVTAKSRKFMEDFPEKKLPSDYVEYPGKLDHTTCLAFQVRRPQSLIESQNK